jgi:transposase
MGRRKSMRRIKECFRLHFDLKLNQSQIARSLSIGRSTVQDYLSRLEECSIGWPQLSQLTDSEIEQRLYGGNDDGTARTLPDMQWLHEQLRSPGVTLMLLWQEYRKEHPDGYGYTQFCDYYRAWKKRLRIYMRQTHAGGEKVFVDYSGKKPRIYDHWTAQYQPVELFVMVWGASHYVYAEAQPSQELEHWIMGHVRAFEYFGCVPAIVVPDNLKSGVSKACWYDPEINRTYNDLAVHYGFGVVPARPGKCRDKAKVENGVQLVQRWIVARLRHTRIATIHGLNRDIGQLLEELNNKPMQVLKKSRIEFFGQLDKPNARLLQVERFVFHEWSSPRIGFDYHIEVNKHFYSVPYQWYGHAIDVRTTEQMVEVFLRKTHERIALHERDDSRYKYTTCTEHMPMAHRKHLEWTPARLLNWAKKNGPQTEQLIDKLFTRVTHPQQAFRPATGILRLGNRYGTERLEAACGIALRFKRFRVKQIDDILKKNLDRKESGETTGTVENSTQVRGCSYFNESEKTEVV